jgi:hypothetical protein
VVVGGVITVRSLKRSRGGRARVARGGICLRTWCRGRRRGNATAAGLSMALRRDFAAVQRAHGIDTADLDAGVQ